jgi:hypothetical protein
MPSPIDSYYYSFGLRVSCTCISRASLYYTLTHGRRKRLEQPTNDSNVVGRSEGVKKSDMNRFEPSNIKNECFISINVLHVANVLKRRVQMIKHQENSTSK